MVWDFISQVNFKMVFNYCFKIEKKTKQLEQIKHVSLLSFLF
jgi:hypothetical protein